MIRIQNMTLRRGSKVLLDNVSLTIHPGEKVGLIGRNGAGKSSLFSLLCGSLQEDSGEVLLPKDWLLAQVAQEMPETDLAATAFVVEGDVRLLRAQQMLNQAESSGDGMALAQAHTALIDAGAHDAHARAQTLLMGLGFSPAQLMQAVNSFSGGWRMRLQLARALMCPSDLLLLDEPTNHLDLDALVWLESWLKRYEGTLVVISHDREFLDAVTRVTMHIDNQTITRYGGNYSQYEVLRAQAMEVQSASYAKQQEKIAHLQKFIDRFKAKASKAKQAQSRVKALERMERIAPVLTSADFAFEFRPPEAVPNPMLTIREANLGYFKENPKEQISKAMHLNSDELASLTTPGTAPITILQNITCSVQVGQRIGILGANGQGKSTFIKSIVETLPLISGTMTKGKGLKIGYFAQQELDVLRISESPLAHMQRLSQDLRDGSREQDWRNFLGQFQFKADMVQQAVGTMSGGEKARLVLAMLVWQRPNLLLLDEPTNHLDITTREALSIALNGFEGAMLLVSHDRSLLRETCDEFWLVSQGGVRPFEGDLDDYQAYLLQLAKDSAAQHKFLDKEKEATTPRPQSPQSQQTSPLGRISAKEQRRMQAQERQARQEAEKPLRRAIVKAEQEMAALTTEQTQLEQQLCEPLEPQEIVLISKRLKELQEALAYAEQAWLQASEALELLNEGTGV